MAASGVGHLPQQLLHLPGFGGGAVGGQDLLADHVLVGADKAHLGPQHPLQHGLEEVSGGGLAVGAGDGQHRQFLRRMAEPVDGHRRQGRPGISRHQPRPFFRRRAAAEYRRRPLIQRLLDIPVAVGLVARQGHEETAGRHVSGVVADT